MNLARGWYPDGPIGLVLFLVALAVVLGIFIYYGMKNKRHGSSGGDQ